MLAAKYRHLFLKPPTSTDPPRANPSVDALLDAVAAVDPEPAARVTPAPDPETPEPRNQPRRALWTQADTKNPRTAVRRKGRHHEKPDPPCPV